MNDPQFELLSQTYHLRPIFTSKYFCDLEELFCLFTLLANKVEAKLSHKRFLIINTCCAFDNRSTHA